MGEKKQRFYDFYDFQKESRHASQRLTWPGNMTRKVTPLATSCESGDAFPHRRLSTLQHLIDATGQRAGPVQSRQVKNGLHTLKIDLLNPKNWLVSRCVSFSRAFSQVSEVCRQTS